MSLERSIGRILVGVSLLASVTVSSLEARTIACPQKGPLFKVTIPDSWSATWDKDGSFTCMPRNQSKYVSVVPSENVRTKEELRAQLTRTARDAARNAKMKDLKLGPIRDSSRSDGMNRMRITAQGVTGGKSMVFTLVAFAPRRDNYFTLLALEPIGARDNEIDAIINSISSTR